MVSEDDEEEKLLKIHYQDSKRFIEIPLESNGKVLSKDITCMDSRISALIIQKRDSKRMVKLKDGYVKEPKETWENVKVYAVLEENQEVKSNRVTSAENSNPDVTDNWNTRIKSETPAVLTEEILNNNQPGVTRSMTSSSNGCSIQNKVNIEARAMSTAVQKRGYLFSDSDESDNSSEDKIYGADVGSNSNVDKSSYSKKAVLKEFCPDEGITESANSITVIDESMKELLLAYKVSSLKELEAKLCRGDFKYSITFDAAINRFKQTMVAYPNDEFVRLIHFARRAKIMMKKLDSSANDVCVLCDEDFTLKHLVSQKHADMYHQKYNADPPEVALLLNPKIYKKYIDPFVLKGLKIWDFRKMEGSSNFSISGSNEALFKLKYILINRIIQENFAANSITNFSLRKIVFLRNNSNHSAFQTIFTTDDFECRSCKGSRNNLQGYLAHILSEGHLQNSLNQEEFNNICKAMTFIRKTPNKGYHFITSKAINRKRKKLLDNGQNGVKRQKMS